jgi:hypothetical protein
MEPRGMGKDPTNESTGSKKAKHHFDPYTVWERKCMNRSRGRLEAASAGSSLRETTQRLRHG